VNPVARITALAILTVCSTACSDESAILITVKNRPAVSGSVTLAVELKNGAGLAGDSFEVRGKVFPLSFSVSAPGRRGDLEVTVSARNDANQLVGRGSARIALAAATGDVTLEPADFVVNTDYPERQYLTLGFESAGVQLAANSDGEWIVAFREDCTVAACSVFARRFNRVGQPLSSALAAGTNAFKVNTGRVGPITTAVAAAGADRSLLFWESVNPVNAPDGVACRPIDRTGAATVEKRLATEISTAAVVATALPTGNFAVAWAGRPDNTVQTNIRTLVVDNTCTPLPTSTLQVVGTTIPPLGQRQSAIAAGPDSYLVAWRSSVGTTADGSIRARTISPNGIPISDDTLLLNPPPGEDYAMVRMIANGGGYVMVVSHIVGEVATLELYRVTANATTPPKLDGPATVITDKFEGPFNGFSIASNPLGPILVVWHGCGIRGDGEGCGVFGRIISSSGIPTGEAFLIPTTTILDQYNPSATAMVADDGQPLFAVSWNDYSTVMPDIEGIAVRARIVYPPVAVP
jgi:hypothetical protein